MGEQMTEYVEFIAGVLQFTAILGNIVLAYLVFAHGSYKKVFPELEESEGLKANLGVRAARWILSSPSHATLLLLLWMMAFLAVPLFVPEVYRAEMLDVILANIFSIPLPIMPFIAANSAGIHYQRRKEEQQKQASMQNRNPNA
ncbi:MAG: hypothetical protein EAX95_10090 [Candidatus Thorarchaeota archaeon]|nr:hypothetical protein [Candidatus Thorarchaeota archaeon]